jgi:glucan phosphoethanolaminetransferase (alkaline phosphatase superfamily)
MPYAQTICQWLLVLLLAVSFFANVYQDFHGRPSRDAGGFVGFVVTCVVTVLILLVFFGAGAFSALGVVR